MTKQKNDLNVLKSNSGFLSVDFMFSIVVCSMICMMFFALTTTLSVIELSQYVAFSVSRAHMAGDVTILEQRNAAINKFKILVNSTTTSHLADIISHNGWFTIKPIKDEQIKSGKTNGFFDEYDENSADPIAKTGVRLGLEVSILKMNIPFLGSTKNEEFNAQITGLLIREPTVEECREALDLNNRYNAIRNIDSARFGTYPLDADAYTALEDNGC